MRHSRGAISTSSHSHSTKSIRSYDGSRSSKEILYGTDGDIKKAKTTKIPRATKPGVDRLRHTWHSPSRSSRTTMDLLYGDNRKIDELDHRSSRHSSASEPGMERVLGTLELLYGDDQDDVKCKARVSKSSRSSKPGVEQVGGDDDDGYSYDFPIASVPREVYSNTVTLPATVGDAAGYDEPSAHDSRNDHHSTATADSVTIVVQGNSREKRRTSPLCIILCILFVLLILVVAVVAGFVLLQDRSDNSNENTQAILGGATNITDAPTPSVTLFPTGVLNSSAPTMIPSTRSPSGAPPT
ncbi:unnamed protein product [Cylindrotheca closterium]|nr:unnamed protein product [Cylindrotheca closterium]